MFRFFKFLISSMLALALSSAYAASYSSVENYLVLKNDFRVNSLIQLKSTLVKDFNFICPDTFCEGNFHRISSVDWQCSVQNETEFVSSCSWIFAGAVQQVDESTGEFVVVDSQVFTCPVSFSGSLDELLTLHLTKEEGGPDNQSTLSRKLPTGSTVFEELMKCL